MTFDEYIALCNELGIVLKDGISIFNNKTIATFWFYNNFSNEGVILIVSNECRFLNSCKEIDDAKQKMLERMKEIKQKEINKKIADLNKDFE